MPSLKGHLLVATPQLLAPIFSRSVVLLLDHSEEGAMGVVLNRPTEVTVASISEEVFGAPSDWEKPILLGGPVPGPLVVLYPPPEGAPGPDPERLVAPGVLSSSEIDAVNEVVGRKAEPSVLVANYAGWSAGQLEGEIERGSWVVLPARAAHVFTDRAGDALWEAVTKEYNGRQLAGMLRLRGVPDDPGVN